MKLIVGLLLILLSGITYAEDTVGEKVGKTARDVKEGYENGGSGT